MIKFPGMRRRSLGSPKQCYADDGMGMDTHAQQQQQSYAFHEESWSSESDNNNSYHKQQFPAGMHMKKPNGRGHHHGYGHSMHDGGEMLGGSINSSYYHHLFPNGVAPRFNSGHGHHGYSSEECCEEYKEYSEVIMQHRGVGEVKMDDVIYEHHNNWGRDHAYYADPYEDEHEHPWEIKPHGYGGHKVQYWTPKGV